MDNIDVGGVRNWDKLEADYKGAIVEVEEALSKLGIALMLLESQGSKAYELRELSSDQFIEIVRTRQRIQREQKLLKEGKRFPRSWEHEWPC